jgi:hypothetical protein
MVLEFKTESLMAKLAVLGAGLCLCGLLLAVIVARFITATLTDDRVTVSRDLLASGLRYFPGSPRLHGKFAETEVLESDRNLANAEAAAQTAINLSPYDFRYRLSMATIKETIGDPASAETALKEALQLAPNNTTAHWRLANVLLRNGKLDESLGEFRAATSADESLLGGTFDLIWRLSGGNGAALQSVTAPTPRARLKLARFLLSKSRLAESAEVFRGLSRHARLGNGESGTFLSELIAAGGLATAKSLWLDLKGAEPEGPGAGPIFNGGFESDILRDFSQFDWTIGRSDFARVSLDTTTFHSGGRSLRLDFIGRDTTKLSGEIKQLIVVRPGGRYDLECWVKSGDLISPEAPKVVVTSQSSKELASSKPLPTGSTQWQRVALEFTAPEAAQPGVSAVYVTLQRIPRYAYDDPTRGTLWLDDFAVKEK